MIANATHADTKVETTDHEVAIMRDDRRYRVRGLVRNTSYDQLKINLMVSRDGLMHVDTLDLYDARRRITFCRQAATELFGPEKGSWSRKGVGSLSLPGADASGTIRGCLDDHETLLGESSTTSSTVAWGG